MPQRAGAHLKPGLLRWLLLWTSWFAAAAPGQRVAPMRALRVPGFALHIKPQSSVFKSSKMNANVRGML